MTSFSMDDILQVAAVQDEAGNRPRWWWLFARDVGTTRNQPVEQMVVVADPATSEPDLLVTGREAPGPNSHVSVTSKFGIH